MGNGYNPDVHRERYKCELCLGQEGDEIVDPYTGEPYRVRVTQALPLRRRTAGTEKWRTEPICEHCAETIQLAAGAAGGHVRLYSLKETFQEARRRDWEITRRNCKTNSIVRHHGVFPVKYPVEDDHDGDTRKATGTDGGS